jgi:hypothetical protein
LGPGRYPTARTNPAQRVRSPTPRRPIPYQKSRSDLICRLLQAAIRHARTLVLRIWAQPRCDAKMPAVNRLARLHKSAVVELDFKPLEVRPGTPPIISGKPIGTACLTVVHHRVQVWVGSPLASEGRLAGSQISKAGLPENFMDAPSSETMLLGSLAHPPRKKTIKRQGEHCWKATGWVSGVSPCGTRQPHHLARPQFLYCQ